MSCSDDCIHPSLGNTLVFKKYDTPTLAKTEKHELDLSYCLKQLKNCNKTYKRRAFRPWTSGGTGWWSLRGQQMIFQISGSDSGTTLGVWNHIYRVRLLGGDLSSLHEGSLFTSQKTPHGLGAGWLTCGPSLRWRYSAAQVCRCWSRLRPSKEWVCNMLLFVF